MLTLDQVRRETRRMGANITPRTFWRYIELGLLPEGQRYPGMGNVFYFPDDTPTRLIQIQTLKKDLGIPLRLIRKSLLYLLEERPWDLTPERKPISGRDLIVWFAGVMARLRLVQKERLEAEDFNALFQSVIGMFRAFGIGEDSADLRSANRH